MRRERVADVGLFLVLGAPAAFALGIPEGLSEAPQAVGLVGLAGAVAVARRFPAVALAGAIALTALHGNFAFAIPVMSLLAGRRMARVRPVVWALCGVFALGTVLHLVRGEPAETWFQLTWWFVVAGVLPWLLGRYWRLRADLEESGWERARRLEREQRIVGERERLRERARIAADLHDRLGHELSLLALRAAALELAADLPERHRTAAADVREGAAAATERLQEILGILRPGDAATRPSGETVADLVERAAASGMAVTLDESGPPAPALADRAAHRIVQEALTNAAKHAPGAAVCVNVTRTDHDTSVEIINNPPPAGPLPSAPGNRLGLTGLRERVRLTGGTLTATPEAHGFALRAHLPHTPPPTHPDHPTPAHPDPTRSALAQFDPARVDPGRIDLDRAGFGRFDPVDPDLAGYRDADGGPVNAGVVRGGASGAGWDEVDSAVAARRSGRRAARRGLAAAVAVPVALVGALGLAMAAYYTYTGGFTW
ncbi:sensor histidine kinase [Actinocorallia sp. A-T 12471]|uniref:sensor histidine kinase n=1 Tax=Actinocorallia sp. A-T 12471 TaxID=3089813 RepID=UPI0029CFD291|nr:histidine kinase [Actinocorallia sp. A-T 12471]MDX6738939.1 histidine kinase [Actinocorallia sp. A-T 12471]